MVGRVIPTLQGVTLSFGAARMTLPLQAVAGEGNGRESAGPRLQPPRIKVPSFAGEFELNPIRDIAVRELLTHAADGRATVHLPFIASTLRKGPFAFDIPQGTEAVIEMEVAGGRILRDRDRTHGTVAPPISLPLGLEFRGIYVDDKGSLIADISAFPDIKLRWFGSRSRVPESLSDLVAQLFKEPTEGRAETQDPAAKPSKPSLKVDTAGISVQARDVVPNDKELHLGDAGALSLGADTRLDVDLSPHALVVSGDFAIVESSLDGAGFAVRDLAGRGAGSLTLQRSETDRSLSVKLALDHLGCAGATLRLQDGSHLELGEVSIEGAEFELRRVGGEVSFAVRMPVVRVHVRGGVFMTSVDDGNPHAVELDEMDLEGSLSLSDETYAADFEIKGAMITSGELSLPLGAAHLDLLGMRAHASGRFQISPDGGYAFDGSMAVNAEVHRGQVVSENLRADLVEGTSISLNINEFAGGPRLRALRGNGEVAFSLESGAVDLSNGTRLVVSRGARGTLAVHDLALTEEARWPRLEAGADLRARYDATTLDGRVALPGGLAKVRLPRLALDESGELLLEDIEVTVDSDTDDAASEDAAPEVSQS